MAIILWALCAAVALVLLFCGMTYRSDPATRFSPPNGLERTSKEKAVSYFAYGLALALIGSPLYLEFPDWQNKLYSIEKDGTLIEHPFGAFDITGQKFVLLRPKEEPLGLTTSHVSPITSNPKVRMITYRIEGMIYDPATYLKKVTRRDSNGVKDVANREVRAVLEYWAYEFNNAYSKELAAFYNPRDDEQLSKFAWLVEEYFNEKLRRDGIQVVFQGFDVH